MYRFMYILYLYILAMIMLAVERRAFTVTHDQLLGAY